MNKNLKLLSMEDLSRLARNEGEDLELRRTALILLRSRERHFYQKLLHIGNVSNYHVNGLSV